jgi:hypothetical protein
MALERESYSKTSPILMDKNRKHKPEGSMPKL